MIELAREYMIAAGFKEMIEESIDAQRHAIREMAKSQIPQDERDEALEELDNLWKLADAAVDTDEIVELIAPVVAAHFTEQELRDIIAFFHSPTGRMMQERGLLIVAEATKVFAPYLESKLNNLLYPNISIKDLQPQENP